MGAAVIALPYRSGILPSSVCVAGWAIQSALLCIFALYPFGITPGGKQCYDNLVRIGFVNDAGEAPYVMQCAKCNLHYTYTFWGKGFPASTWVVRAEEIESALNICILSIEEGDDRRTVIINCVPAKGAMPRLAPWRESLISQEDFEIAIGLDAAAQPVYIDLSAVPHVLIGAATGMGKTLLLKLIVFQLIIKSAEVYLADWKGVDYQEEYRNTCHYTTDTPALLLVLDSFLSEIESRRTLFNDSKCANITEYNEHHPTAKLCRKVLVMDETSMILDSTGRTKDEKEEIARILNKLVSIGRLGRAFGLHLIVATQRPDVASVPGSLKAQLDCRICGHTADAQSSIVIMDDGSAAKLPAIPGRFLVRDGSGIDKTVQVYATRH